MIGIIGKTMEDAMKYIEGTPYLEDLEHMALAPGCAVAGTQFDYFVVSSRYEDVFLSDSDAWQAKITDWVDSTLRTRIPPGIELEDILVYDEAWILSEDNDE